MSPAFHGHDDDFLFDGQVAELHDARPTARCVCGHIDAYGRLVCWQCEKLQNVNAEIQRIARATEKEFDREWLESLGVRYDG